MKKLAFLVTVIAFSGCALEPVDRANFAKRSMVFVLSEGEFALEYREKVLETKVSGGLPGETPGGGCGCTQ